MATQEKEIERLTGAFWEMGLAVSEQLYQATAAFARQDHDLAEQVIATDQAVNATEVELERRAMLVLALKQPLASDFRQVMTVEKASVDLERIGDGAVDIAREALIVPAPGLPAAAERLSQMTLAIQTMLEQVLDAYVRNEPALARTLVAGDLTVDRAFERLRRHLTSGVGPAPVVASYLFVARLLERIGDHVVNVAEWIVYRNTGELVELNPGKNNRQA